MPDKKHLSEIGRKGGLASKGTEAAKERGSKGGLAKAAKRRAAIPDDKLTRPEDPPRWVVIGQVAMTQAHARRESGLGKPPSMMICLRSFTSRIDW